MGIVLRGMGRFVVNIAVSEVHTREEFMNLGWFLLCVLGLAVAMVVINALHARTAGQATRRRRSAMRRTADPAICRLH